MASEELFPLIYVMYKLQYAFLITWERLQVSEW
jgi:hypothetical protein